MSIRGRISQAIDRRLQANAERAEAAAQAKLDQLSGGDEQRAAAVAEGRALHRAAVARLAAMGGDMRTQAELAKAEAQDLAAVEYDAWAKEQADAAGQPVERWEYEQQGLEAGLDPDGDHAYLVARGREALARDAADQAARDERPRYWTDEGVMHMTDEWGGWSSDGEWADHDNAEHDAQTRQQEDERAAEEADPTTAYVTTDDGDTATPAWLRGAEPADAARTSQPDLDTYPYNLSADEFNQARQDAAVRAAGEADASNPRNALGTGYDAWTQAQFDAEDAQYEADMARQGRRGQDAADVAQGAAYGMAREAGDSHEDAADYQRMWDRAYPDTDLDRRTSLGSLYDQAEANVEGYGVKTDGGRILGADTYWEAPGKLAAPADNAGGWGSQDWHTQGGWQQPIDNTTIRDNGYEL